VRLEQRFGGDYTAKVLTGSKDQRILEQGHDNLSTYGILEKQNHSNVRDWIEQLVSQKFLEKVSEYNVLEVTSEGRRLLRGELTPQLLKPKRTTKKDRKTKSKQGVAADSWEGVDEGLFEELRVLRREKAELMGVPAFVVFGDAALRDMARRRPSTLEGFLEVKGVGEKKRDDYGEEFLECIGNYCQQHQVAMDIRPEETVKVSNAEQPQQQI